MSKGRAVTVGPVKGRGCWVRIGQLLLLGKDTAVRVGLGLGKGRALLAKGSCYCWARIG